MPHISHTVYHLFLVTFRILPRNSDFFRFYVVKAPSFGKIPMGGLIILIEPSEKCEVHLDLSADMQHLHVSNINDKEVHHNKHEQKAEYVLFVE